jgi:hypothetical protein
MGLHGLLQGALYLYFYCGSSHQVRTCVDAVAVATMLPHYLIWGSYSGRCEHCYLLGCDAV